MVAAAKRLRCFCFWPNSTRMSDTILSGGGSQIKLPKATVGLLVRLLRRLAVPRGRQVCDFPFLGLWDHSSRLQRRDERSQTDVGNSPGNRDNPGPNVQALECCRRHFGTRSWVSQDGSGPHGRSSQAISGGPPGTRFAALPGQVQGSHRRYGQAQAAATTMTAHAQAAGAKNIDPGVSSSPTSCARLAKEVREGTPDIDTKQAALRRGRGAARPMRQPPSCSRSCGWA